MPVRSAKILLTVLIICSFPLHLLAQPAIEWDTNDPASYMDFARGLQNMGEYDAAIEAYNRALELNPALYEAYLEKARLYLRLEMPDHAIREYRIVAGMDSATAEMRSSALFGIGAILFRDEAYADAKSYFLRTIEENPGHAQGYYYLGRCYEWEENYEDAADAYREAIDLAPDVLQYDRALSRVLDELIW